MTKPALETLMSAASCRELARLCEIPGPAESALLSEVASRRNDQPFRRLLQHYRRTVFQSTQRDPLVGWPAGESDRAHALVYCLILLDLADRIRRHHRALGIDPEITRQTVVAKVGTAIRQFWDRAGFIGARSNVFVRTDWYLAAMPLVCLGTFSYEPRAWGGGACVFRDGNTGKLKLLAEDGAFFDACGRQVPADQAGHECFSATLEVGDMVHGFPITPHGDFIRRRVELDPAEWQPVLRKGDPVLQMHIPFDTDLSPAACRESLLAAIGFYERHFPDYGASFFACGSWTFSPDLKEILSSDGNMLKLQNAVYLTRNAADCRGAFKYIFGYGDFNPQTAPRKTSLQRGILDLLRRGSILHKGAMILPFSQAGDLGVRGNRE